ncbi:MAG: hypothetical protein E6Q97_34725 [Desulfurellales bacterium]|nr:MAG: hypothetical protein E6Q97_34725 [Desulfurellales bacterium]
MKNIAIIYHDADFDGKLSNEVCKFHLGRLYPEAKIHSYGWDYGRLVPEPDQIDTDNATYCGAMADWCDYNQIYIVDLSVDELMARPELRDKIVWIDHHKSAIEKWHATTDANGKEVGYLFNGHRIDGVAACRLCWQWFSYGPNFGDPRPTKADFVERRVSEPTLIRLAGEYDIWDHRDPDAKALQFGLRCCNESELANLVCGQFHGTPESEGVLRNVIEGGRMVKSYCDRNNAEYAAAYALAGKDAIPTEPIRRGEKSASIVLETQEIVVTRKFTAKGSTLEVTNKDGMVFPSPQAVLDKLCSKVAFDPLAFVRLGESVAGRREQLRQLRDLVGVDTIQITDETVEAVRECGLFMCWRIN